VLRSSDSAATSSAGGSASGSSSIRATASYQDLRIALASRVPVSVQFNGWR
jgi:hypothetical protein